MDKPPTRKEITHERIVATAARALRRGGFDGVGVADIMGQAGLTHGGFYAHFPSRDALLCEALERAGQESAARVAGRPVNVEVGASPFRAFIESYLSDRHLASPESGCPVAALASEMPRQPLAVAKVAAARIRNLIAAVGDRLPQGTSRDVAGVIAGQLVGALQLARAVGDVAEGRALLAASRRALLEQYDLSAH